MTSGRCCFLISPLLLLLLSAACSTPSMPNVGSESHWLAECSVGQDCGDGLACICGACTRRCSMDAACAGDIPAACYDRSSPALVQRCEGSEDEPSAGVCLRECVQSSECAESKACIEGACVPRLASDPVSAPVGGTSDGGADPLSSAELDELLSMDTAVDRSTPVSSVPRLSGVSGGDESITGTWVEENCDPAEAVAERAWGCVQLTLARDASGAVAGTLQIDGTALTDRPLDPAPPYPPAKDPNVGYPLGADPRTYTEYVNVLPGGIPYRVLDGHFDNGRLTFAWSPYDLWHDWCALQTSYRWMVGDHAFAFCVPQDRTQWTELDEGRIVLCTSADFEPLCSSGDDLLPCPCLEEGHPRCTPAYCQCDDTGCDANVGWFLNQVELSVDGETMTGSWRSALYGWSGTLHRVSP